jgi:hypothetical protein
MPDWHGLSAVVAHVIFDPDDKYLVAAFYLFWMIAYLAVNIGWDIFTERTPPFHMSNLRNKFGTAHAAAMFASSLLLLIGSVAPHVASAIGETIAPLVLVGVSGLLFALSQLCPYELNSGSSPI